MRWNVTPARGGMEHLPKSEMTRRHEKDGMERLGRNGTSWPPEWNGVGSYLTCNLLFTRSFSKSGFAIRQAKTLSHY